MDGKAATWQRSVSDSQTSSPGMALYGSLDVRYPWQEDGKLHTIPHRATFGTRTVDVVPIQLAGVSEEVLEQADFLILLLDSMSDDDGTTLGRLCCELQPFADRPLYTLQDPLVSHVDSIQKDGNGALSLNSDRQWHCLCVSDGMTHYAAKLRSVVADVFSIEGEEIEVLPLPAGGSRRPPDQT